MLPTMNSLGSGTTGLTSRYLNPSLAGSWCSANKFHLFWTMVSCLVASIRPTTLLTPCTWTRELSSLATRTSGHAGPEIIWDIQLCGMFRKNTEENNQNVIRGFNGFVLIFCSHLPYVGQWSNKAFSKQDCGLLPPLSGPGLGVASTPQPSVFVYWGQCQVLTMAPPSLSGLVFKAMRGGVHVLEMGRIKAASVQTS